MRRDSASFAFGVGLLAVAAVGAATFGAVQLLGLDDDDTDAGAVAAVGEGPTSTTPGTQPALRDDQVEITGVVNALTVEGGTIDLVPSPLVVTVSSPGAGAGATLTDVEVDGALTEVVWDGGRSFDLAGTGGIRPQVVNLFANPSLVTVGFVDGVANELVPGSYGLETPVAIGRGGLAEPRDAVAFGANVESTLVFRGGATTSFLPRELSFEAGGRVVLEGLLHVRHPDESRADAARVELPEGAYRLTATPRPDGSGYDVVALLQGPTTIT